MNHVTDFLQDERGMTTVEIVLIIVILIALVAIFKREIGNVVESIMSRISEDANSVMN